MPIANGVDTNAFRPGGQREAEPTILFVGTYQNRKRGKLLMEAFGDTILPALPTAKLWMVCGECAASSQRGGVRPRTAGKARGPVSAGMGLLSAKQL